MITNNPLQWLRPERHINTLQDRKVLEVCTMDSFMDYMLLLDDDEEDEPRPGEKPGCGCLPMLVIGFVILIILTAFGH